MNGGVRQEKRSKNPTAAPGAAIPKEPKIHFRTARNFVLK